METSMLLFLLLLCLITAFVARISYVIYKVMSSDCTMVIPEKSLRTIFCIGSGGHTTEMLRFAMNLNGCKYQPRLYILAKSDFISEDKIHQVETGKQKYTLARIPRSRNVNQSYLTAILTTIYATLISIPIVYRFKPNVVFCNGPGTCIPVCVIAFLLKCLFIIDCRIIFVESVCRVRTLSLSGQILQYFADLIVVQWPQLRDVCFRAKYFGRLT